MWVRHGHGHGAGSGTILAKHLSLEVERISALVV